MSTAWQGNSNGQHYDKDGLPVNSGTDNDNKAQSYYDAFAQPQSQQAGQPSYGAQPYGQPQTQPQPQQPGQASPQWGQPQYGQQPGQPVQPWAQPNHGQLQHQYAQPVAQPKSKIVAALLFFFLGELGLGNFYMGQTNLGIAKLIMFAVGIFTMFFLIGFVILGALWIWKLVEFVMVLTGGGGYDRDANGVPLQ